MSGGEPIPLPFAALAPGAVLVHRSTSYLFRLDPTSASAPTLRFLGVGEYRILQLSREEAAAQLRLPIDTACADALERIIVNEAAVTPTPDLDLVLHLRGTHEQVAAAIGTLMDRAAQGSETERAGAASDLRFQHLKLIGELLWAKERPPDLFGRAHAPALHAYEAALRERRAAVPSSERRPTVAPPHVPVVPGEVITDELASEDGSHVLGTHLSPGPELVAASLGDNELDVHERIGATGELFVSTMHRDRGIQWIVLSEGSPATIASERRDVRATIDGETFGLTVGEPHPGQAVIVVQKDHPADLLASINVRLRYPQAQVLVWRFGFAASPGMDDWTMCSGRSPRGRRVWAFACNEDAL
jgi:hypothetical protein